MMTKREKVVVARSGSVRTDTRANILPGNPEFDGSPMNRQVG